MLDTLNPVLLISISIADTCFSAKSSLLDVPIGFRPMRIECAKNGPAFYRLFDYCKGHSDLERTLLDIRQRLN